MPFTDRLLLCHAREKTHINQDKQKFLRKIISNFFQKYFKRLFYLYFICVIKKINVFFSLKKIRNKYFIQTCEYFNLENVCIFSVSKHKLRKSSLLKNEKKNFQLKLLFKLTF